MGTPAISIRLALRKLSGPPYAVARVGQSTSGFRISKSYCFMSANQTDNARRLAAVAGG